MSSDFPITLLVIEVDSAVRMLCRETGEALGFRCSEAIYGAIALSAIPSLSPDIVLTGLNLPDMTGVELLRQIKIMLPRTEVAILTGYGNVDSAVQAIRIGAYHYLTKPLHPAELQLMLQRIEEKVRLARENEYLRNRVRNDQELTEITGASRKIHDVVRMIARLKDTRTPVFITGEKGTGKELVARAIHFRGPLAKRPFVVVDCGALDPMQAEVELFGSAHGRASGEIAATKPGRFQTSHEGTIFLAEIDKLSLKTQDRLLHTIQNGEVRPIGKRIRVKTDVRVIASAAGDFEKALAEGRFHRELYLCLKGATIHMPSLRERTGDIPALVHALIQRHAPNRRVQVTSEAMHCMTTYPWPGNISELQACIEFALAQGNPEVIDWPDLAPEARESVNANVAGDSRSSKQRLEAAARLASSAASGTGQPELPAKWGGRLEEAERAAIMTAIRHAGGDKKAASELLGISRKTLYRKLKGYGIVPQQKRGEPGRSSLENVLFSAGGDTTSVRNFLGGSFVNLCRKNKRNGLPLPRLETTDRATLETIVHQTGGDIAIASKLLGIDRTTLFRLLKRVPPPTVPAIHSLATTRGRKPDRSG
jgi:DNA-binding NtrC family response regulator